MITNKLDAGILQLREAIKLFFEQRDPIAIHTITGAASLLLYNLCEHEDIESYVRGNSHIREGYLGSE